MDYPQLIFEVQIESIETLRQVGERVGQALGCQFAPSYDPVFVGNEGLEALSLGLFVTLHHHPEHPEGDVRTYHLKGRVRDDVEAELDPGSPTWDISRAILGVMQTVDSPDWYIAEQGDQLLN
jgi:hypothetical protein